MPILSFSVPNGPVGFQVSTVGQARANLSPDAFELFEFCCESTHLRERDVVECALAGQTDLTTPVLHTAGGPSASVSVVFAAAHSSGGTLADGQVDAPDQITAEQVN